MFWKKAYFTHLIAESNQSLKAAKQVIKYASTVQQVILKEFLFSDILKKPSSLKINKFLCQPFYKNSTCDCTPVSYVDIIIYCLLFVVNGFHVFCGLLCNHKKFCQILHANTMKIYKAKVFLGMKIKM